MANAQSAIDKPVLFSQYAPLPGKYFHTVTQLTEVSFFILFPFR